MSAAALVAGAGSGLTALPAEGAAGVTQTKSCVDGGGTPWTVRSIWGRVYTEAGGDRRVQNDITGFTTTSSRVTRVDYIVWTYGPDGRRTQDLRESNRRFDFRDGTAYLRRNVRNPISGAGRTKIKVKVGDGGDGKSKCSVIFVQPGATSTPTTPPPTTPTPSLDYDTVQTTGYTLVGQFPARIGGDRAPGHPPDGRGCGHLRRPDHAGRGLPRPHAEVPVRHPLLSAEMAEVLHRRRHLWRVRHPFVNGRVQDRPVARRAQLEPGGGPPMCVREHPVDHSGEESTAGTAGEHQLDLLTRFTR